MLHSIWFLDYKISSLKTHDYYNLLYYLFPIAIRGLLSEGVSKVIYYLEALFH